MDRGDICDGSIVTLRLLQVGLGKWGMDWAVRVVAQNRAIHPVGFVIRSPANATAAKQALGCADEMIFASIHEAQQRVAADAILITTGTDAHTQLIRQALEAGLHVLVEKPFVGSLEDARALVELARARNRVLMINQNFRFFPAARRAAELVRSQAHGRLNAISVDFRRNAARGDAVRGDWLRQQPQPLLFDMAIHHFDLLRMIVGSEARSVTCSAWKPALSRFIDPSCAAALLQFDGVTASWTGTWETPGADTPYAGHWRLTCENAEIHFTCRGDRDLTLDADEVVIVEGEQRRIEPLNKSGLFGRAAVLAGFTAAVEGRADDPYLPLGADNFASLQLTLAVIQASQTGGTQAVETHALPNQL